MTVRNLEDDLLGARGSFGDPPPPSAELLRTVAEMKPVRTRTRFGAFAVVALVGLLWPVLALARLPMRRDLAALPLWWVITAAALWGAAFVLSLAAALVPRRGDVLPAPGRASLVSGAAMALVLLFALAATAQAPGLSVQPEGAWSLFHACVHCITFVLEISAAFLLVGLVTLRRLVPTGRPRIGMALGAAGGAMGGLVLHFICPIAGTAHVVLAHVGGMILAASAGAVLLAGVLRRPVKPRPRR
jgi:hypothetical protein